MHLDHRAAARRLLLAAPLAALAVVASACTSSGGAPGAQSPPVTRTVTRTEPAPSTSAPTSGTAPRTRTVTATDSVPVTPSAGSDTSSSGGSAGSPCATSDLRLTAGQGNGAAGTEYLTFGLVNTASAPCTLFGYPGVSVLDGSGQIVQKAAARNSSLDQGDHGEQTVTVAPGKRAVFVVSAVDTDPDPRCRGARTGTALRVYPPNQTRPIVQQGRYQACELQVGAVSLP